MAEDLYQNIDTQIDNPLQSTELPSEAAKPKFNLKDPKIVILTVLGIVLIILVIASLVVTISRKDRSNHVTLPNTTVKESPTPTQVQSVVPSGYYQQFDTIQKQINTNEDYPPPPIDLQIGL